MLSSGKIKVSAGIEETRSRLAAVLIPEPTDTMFRMSAPTVYDRVIGSLCDDRFEARLFSGQVGSNSVTVTGQVRPRGERTDVDLDFSWGNLATRAIVWITGLLGLFLCTLGYFSSILLLFGGCLTMFAVLRLLLAHYERRCIMETLEAGLLKGDGV